MAKLSHAEYIRQETVTGTVPMMKAQKCAEAGEPIPVIGSKEFRYMAKSYNKMHEKLYGSKEETK